MGGWSYGGHGTLFNNRTQVTLSHLGERTDETRPGRLSIPRWVVPDVKNRVSPVHTLRGHYDDV